MPQNSAALCTCTSTSFDLSLSSSVDCSSTPVCAVPPIAWTSSLGTGTLITSDQVSSPGVSSVAVSAAVAVTVAVVVVVGSSVGGTVRFGVNSPVGSRVAVAAGSSVGRSGSNVTVSVRSGAAELSTVGSPPGVWRVSCKGICVCAGSVGLSDWARAWIGWTASMLAAKILIMTSVLDIRNRDFGL